MSPRTVSASARAPPLRARTRATNEHASSTYFLILVTPRRFTAVTIRGPRSSSGRVVDSPPRAPTDASGDGPSRARVEVSRPRLASPSYLPISANATSAFVPCAFPFLPTSATRSQRADAEPFCRLDRESSRAIMPGRTPPRLAAMVSFPTPTTTRVVRISEFTSRVLRTQATSTTGGHGGRAELGTDPNRPPTTPRTATQERTHDVHPGSH